MRTLKSSFKFPWLIALSLALFSCAQTTVEQDASNENGVSAERSHWRHVWSGWDATWDLLDE